MFAIAICVLFARNSAAVHTAYFAVSTSFGSSSNLYGSKNAGLVFYEHLKQGLKQIGFMQSKVDEGVFYRGKLMFLIYVDDGILLHPDAKEIDKVIAELRALKYNISDEGDISDYLGVKVQALADGNIKLSQPQMIRTILKDLGFNE